MAMAGILMGYAGDWQRAVEVTTTAMELSPHHPGWYRLTTFFNEYRQKRYAEALAIAQKINLPDYFPTHYAAAIAHAQLGNLKAAKAAADEARRLWPEFERDVLVEHLGKWFFPQPDLIEHLLEGLEKAGFRVRRPGGEGDSDKPTTS
jgi:tetratricopeptide (TPR) repeat protein